MYGRETTELIVECASKGLTGLQTIKYIKKKTGKQLGIATVYRHRHSLTAQQIIAEIDRQQRFDIASCEDSALRLKYRDNMLNRLQGQKIMSYHREDVNIQETKREELNVTLEDYRDSVQKVVDRYIRQNNPT